MVDVWVAVVVWGWWVFGGSEGGLLAGVGGRLVWPVGVGGWMGCLLAGGGVGTLSSVGVCWPGGRVDVGSVWVCCWVVLAEWLWMLPDRPCERMGNIGRHDKFTMGSVGQSEQNTAWHGQ